jgi:Putative peptidoglycan binding domain
MNWVIGLAIALVLYAFVFRSRERGALVNSVAHGGAGGARKATLAYYRRRDLIWMGVAVLVGFIALWMLLRDDDTPAAATEVAEATPTTEGISSPLIVGDQGADVTLLQERLAAEGVPVTVDSVYGQETADAVMAFQEQEQLIVDGVVGSETGEALGIWSG